MDPLQNDLTVEPMTLADLDQVTAIEKESFPEPWTSGGFRAEMEREPAVCLVLKLQKEPAGYLIFWRLPPEIHVLNIAVSPRLRNLGLGRFLLEYMFEYGRELKIEQVWLEVRESNLAARRLYEKTGFFQTGRRINYYSRQNEDALLMTRRLWPGPETI